MDSNIKKELENNQTVLSIIPSDKYTEICVSDVKILALKGAVCYVTLNKTAEALKESFKKRKVNLKNVIFIDTITKTLKKTPNQADQVYYVSSPSALTELSISIEKFLRHEFDYIILDSLTNFLVYQKKAPVAKFISSIINKIKQTKTKSLLYAIAVKDQGDLIRQSETFVDKVINFNEVSKE